MSPERAIELWSEISVRLAGDGLGYSGSTSLHRAMNGNLAFGAPCGGHLPRHVDMPGLRGYLAVERTLDRLRPFYRQTLEAVHVLPTVVVGRGHQQVAAYLGIPVATLNSRLQRIKAALRGDQGATR